MTTNASSRAAKAWSGFRALFARSRQGIADTVVSAVPQGVSLVSGFVVSILLARGLGPAGMGQYALVLSFAGLVAGLTDLGIQQTAIRFASRAVALGNADLQYAVLRWAFRVRMTLMLVAIAIAFVAAPSVAARMWHAPELPPLARLGLLSCLLAGIASVPAAYLQSLRRFKMNAGIYTSQTVVLLGGVLFLAVTKRWSVASVVIVNVAAAAAPTLLFALFTPGRVFFAPSGTIGSWRTILPRLWSFPHSRELGTDSVDGTSVGGYASYMLISTALVTVTLRADVWLMGVYLTKAQIGVYSVATYFTLPLTMLLAAMNTALWPRVSSVSDRPQAARLLRSMMKISLAAAAACVVYALVAPCLIGRIFGAAYGSGVLVGRLLCIRYTIALAAVPLAAVGYSFGMVRIYWVVNALQLVVVVAANAILLPRVGPIGSALALVANEVVGQGIVAAIMLGKGALRVGHEGLSEPSEA